MLTQEAEGRPEGQASFDMANLRQRTAGLPFVVWVSQRGNDPHDVRVKMGYFAKVFPSRMGTYGIRPFQFINGQRLASADGKLLEQWIARNVDVLVGYRNGDIEYTEDLIDQIKPVG